MNLGSGAISAKAKAMYGKHIQETQYEELARKRNVAEIAQTLKLETAYQEVLKDIHENSIHRGQLELLMRQDLYRRMDRLIRYANNRQKQYYLILLKQIEIDQILGIIRSLISQDFTHVIANIPLYLKRYTKLNVDALMESTDFADLLHALHGSGYDEILKQFQTKDMKNFNYTACETAMQRYYIDMIMQAIDKLFKRKQRRVLKKIWATKIELDNITKIYRYKKFFNADVTIIQHSLIEYQGTIPKQMLIQMIEATNAQALLQLLASSPYHLHMDEKEYVYIEYFTDMIEYHLAKRHMHYDSAPAIVYTAYMILAQREIDNIVHIIEGVRYQIAPEEIMSMVITETKR